MDEHIILNTKKGRGSSQASRAYEFIREAILNQKFKPGYPVFETDLSEQLGMSRTPVHDAINRLKNEGLVESIPGKGNFVRALSKEEVRQNYEIAEGLEGMIAYLAALYVDADGVKKLREYAEAMKRTIAEGDFDNWLIADEAFHSTLYSLCKNRYLVQEMERIHSLIHPIRLTVTRASVNKIESTNEHYNTYEAIRDGDSTRARQVTQDHWRRVRTEILEVIV